jgi:pilus assembly protein CpaE
MLLLVLADESSRTRREEVRPRQMSQDAAKLHGNWKALFLCPNEKLIRELTPLLSRLLPGFSSHDLNTFPSRQEIVDILGQRPSFCLLEVSDPPDRSLSIIPELLRTDAKLPIVALLGKNDPTLGLRCLRHGASDFLIQPFTSDQVEATLQKMTRLQPGRFKNPGKVYAIMPAKGGCGASTIAANFSYGLRRFPQKRLLLADLDPLAGTQSFLLKIKSNYSFMDVLSHAQEIDADLWKAVVSNRQGVDVLLAPELLPEGMGEVNDPAGMIEFARGAYDIVVLDAGGVYGDWNLCQAQLADEILLVTTNELTALQAVQRSLTYLEANNVPAYKVKLVVNRYDRHMGLSRDVIGTALHTEIFHLIPADYEAIQKSLMDGKPMTTSTNFGKSVAALVERIAGASEPARKSSSLSGLLSLFSRTSS